MATFPFENLLSGVKKLWTVPTGADADNAAVTKNPILIGGRFSTTPATRHDGDVTTLETDSTGRLLTVLSGRKAQIAIANSAPATTVVNTTGQETITFAASAGSIATLVHLHINIPAIVGSTGNHRLEIYLGTIAPSNLILDAQVVGTNLIRVNPFGIQNTPTYSTPTPAQGDQAWRDFLTSNGIKFGNAAANLLTIRYSNTTNTDQTGTRTYAVRSVEEAVTW